MTLILLLICGLAAGLLSGMLGIGGGVIVVPSLYFLFYHAGLFETHLMQVAASTSLAISLSISLFSSIVQHSKKAILFPAFKFLAPGLLIGCPCGAVLAHFVSSGLLRQVFGAGALLIGIYFTIPRLPHFSIAPFPNRTLSFFGLIIGTLSSLLGIGGGLFTFPVFLGYGMDGKTAAATSSCVTALSSLIGTMTYLLIAKEGTVLSGNFGYINLRAFLIIGIGALIATPFGIKLAHRLDIQLIKQIFGTCLSLVALTMLLF